MNVLNVKMQEIILTAIPASETVFENLISALTSTTTGTF